MVLSKRERLVLLVAGAGLALLAADRLVIEPLWRARQQVQSDKGKKLTELRRIEQLQDQARRARPKWASMVSGGMKADPAEAEGVIQHALLAWTKEVGVTQTLLKPDRLTGNTRLPCIDFQFTGTGSLQDFARLLYRIQTATVPVKVTDLQITSRKEGSDELLVQMRLSTIYAPPRPGAVAASPPEEVSPAKPAGPPQPDPVRIRSRRRVTPSTASGPASAAWAASEPATEPADTAQPASAPTAGGAPAAEEPAAEETDVPEFDEEGQP